MEIDPTNGQPFFANAYIGFSIVALGTMVCVTVLIRGPACQSLVRRFLGPTDGFRGFIAHFYTALAYVYAYMFPVYVALLEIDVLRDRLFVSPVMQQWAIYGGIAGVGLGALVIWWIDYQSAKADC